MSIVTSMNLTTTFTHYSCNSKAARRSTIRAGLFLCIFILHMRITVISELPVNILTTPLDSVTLISYMVRIFWRSVDIHHVTLTFDPLTLNIVSHVALLTGVIFTKFELGQLVRA